MLKKQLLLAFFLILVGAMLLGCSGTTTSGDPTALPYTGSADTVLDRSTGQLLTGNSQNGQTVFSRHCQTCHSLNEAVVIIGPSLYRAGERLQFEYILSSIENPHDISAEEMYELSMPEDLVERMTPQELADVVAYIASLRE